MLKTYKFRLYPNREQREYFANTFGCTRFIYNQMLADKGDDYYFKKSGFILSDNYNNQKDKISTIKGNEFKNIACNVCGGK